jgi:hypothetical protein
MREKDILFTFLSHIVHNPLPTNENLNCHSQAILQLLEKIQ